MSYKNTLDPHEFRNYMQQYQRANEAEQRKTRDALKATLKASEEQIITMLASWANPVSGYQSYLVMGCSKDDIERYAGKIDLRTYEQLRAHGEEITVGLVDSPQATASIDDVVETETALCLRHEPPLPSWQWPKGPWRPKHCAQMRERMAGFYRTAYGHVAIHKAYDRIGRAYGNPEDFSNTTEANRERLLERAYYWSNPDLMVIHADENFATMTDAAALSAPIDFLKEDELLAPAGAIFFREEVSLQSINPELLIRAIFWRLMPPEMTGVDDDVLTVDLLQDGIAAFLPEEQIRNEIPGFYETERYLVLKMSRNIPISDLVGNSADTNGTVAFIRAMKQIATSPKTVSENVGVGREGTPTQQGRKKSRRHKAAEHETTVRTLSLRQPSHARMELNAATGDGTSAGAGVRQHYVRGHWRNQWYPSLNDHRSIWIDGFVKGDPLLGSVSGPTVHLAR